jgi:hypothetical protein
MKQRPTRVELRLDDLLPKRNARVRKLAPPSGAHRGSVPAVGSRVTIRLADKSGVSADKLTRSIVSHLRKSGPRGGASRREVLTLSAADIESLRALSREMHRWLRANPKNAALFAVDPVAAVTRLGDKVDSGLLRKLRHLERRDRPQRLSRARISSIILEPPRR